MKPSTLLIALGVGLLFITSERFLPPLGKRPTPARLTLEGLPETIQQPTEIAQYATITPPRGQVLAELKGLDTEKTGVISDAELVQATVSWVANQIGDEAYARAVASWRDEKPYEVQFA